MKKKGLLVFLILVLLLGGAYYLYQRLGASYAPDRLAEQTKKENGEEESETGDGNTGEDPDGDRSEEEQKMEAPDFTVYDREGNAVSLKSYVGKPIVLNFWASWCGPCRTEMPDFDETYREMGTQIQFLMVNMTDGSRETVESASAFIDKEGYKFPVFYDTAYEAAITYGVYSLPTTFFIDADGYLVTYASGAISAADLQKGIDMISE